VGKKDKKGRKAKAAQVAAGEVQAQAEENVAREAAWKLHKTKEGKDGKPKYLDELVRLQFELIKLQDWVQKEGLKVAVIF